MRSTYQAMRAAHDGALDSLVGPELGEVRPTIGQEPRFRGPCEGLFYTGLHYALAANGLTWQDGGELKGWRTGDVRLSASNAPESWHKAWMGNGFKFLSELTDDEGALLPWEHVPGMGCMTVTRDEVRRWPEALSRSKRRAEALGGVKQPHGYHRRTACIGAGSVWACGWCNRPTVGRASLNGGRLAASQCGN